MFQKRSMPVVCEFQIKLFPFSKLRNELLSSEEDTNKETCTMIGDIVVTAAKALLVDVQD